MQGVDGGGVEQAGLRARRGKVARANVNPPLVPMIDVVFNILLYFVLTMQFRQAEGQIAGTVPELGAFAGSTAVVQLEPLSVTIRRPAIEGQEATFDVGGYVVRNGEDLYVHLVHRRQRTGSDEVPIIIRPGPDVPWEFAVEVFNQAVRAKFKKVGFAASG